MIFNIIPWGSFHPAQGRNLVYLTTDSWNDLSFMTLFHITLFDENGTCYNLGDIKIGFKGQTDEVSTSSTLPKSFNELPDNYFSLGQDVDYYRKIKNNLSDEFANKFLHLLKDVAFNETNLNVAMRERVFSTSLLRSVSIAAVKGQFKRVLEGGAPLTDFSFIYKRPESENFAGIDLNFKVKAESKPSTNIHAIIGRNGVGKTTLLNGMIEGIAKNENSKGSFYAKDAFLPARPITDDYFSSLVSVSFSAFDPFNPPPEQSDPSLGTCYHYIGLKSCETENSMNLKTLTVLHAEFIESLVQCLIENGKRERWLNAISILESDQNFAEMELSKFASLCGEELKSHAANRIKRMSSGHAVVLLIITKLIDTVEEKTLVLVDEPESHLHPPLLSAFTRALSQLLFNRNGVAIIATHSPVVLQEIPKSCVWKVTRVRLAASSVRPELETFGENVGVLTREVFGLEVVKSGFHTLLGQSVSKGKSYAEIVEEYGDQLGFEAKAILQAMVLNRDQGRGES